MQLGQHCQRFTFPKERGYKMTTFNFAKQGPIWLCNHKHGWMYFFSNNSSISSKGQNQLVSLSQIGISSSLMAMDPMSPLMQLSKHKHLS
jgi:hypothetical protein